MAARGQKSAASLSIVAETIDRRPDPPKHLTKFQKDLWKRIVASEAHDFFVSAALQQMLIEYCRHCASAQTLADGINFLEENGDFTEQKTIAIYDDLLKMRDRETKAMDNKATKLRLTNQSRYVPHTAATAHKQVSEQHPWRNAS